MYTLNFPYHLKRALKKHLGFALVTFLILAVINVGCYVWINNSVAVVPDNDPMTMVRIDLYDDDFVSGQGDLSDDTITVSKAQDMKHTHAQHVVNGNGDRDDNRAESYCYYQITSAAVFPKTIKSSSNFNERHTAAAYKDFGHLKIISINDSLSIAKQKFFTLLEGHPFIAGGLLYCLSSIKK